MGLLKGLSRNYLRFSIGFIEPRLWQRTGGQRRIYVNLASDLLKPDIDSGSWWSDRDICTHAHLYTHTETYREVEFNVKLGRKQWGMTKVSSSHQEKYLPKRYSKWAHTELGRIEERDREREIGEGEREESVHTSFLPFLGTHTLIFWDLPRCRQRQLR